MLQSALTDNPQESLHASSRPSLGSALPPGWLTTATAHVTDVLESINGQGQLLCHIGKELNAVRPKWGNEFAGCVGLFSQHCTESREVLRLHVFVECHFVACFGVALNVRLIKFIREVLDVAAIVVYYSQKLKQLKKSVILLNNQLTAAHLSCFEEPMDVWTMSSLTTT